MYNQPHLTEFHLAILDYLSTRRRKVSEITQEFTSSQLRRQQIKEILGDLKDCGYIKPVKLLSGVVQVISLSDGPDITPETEPGYEITQLGKSRLENTHASYTNTVYANISNSNIAHDSPNAHQAIRISDQSEDIQRKITELQNAVAKKDKSAIVKAFSYIADKSIDVAIALITGGLVK